jgi:alpha-ketoglutarate-dependent taurine dioxygenase
MKIAPMPGHPVPWVISPEGSADAVAFARSERAAIRQAMQDHGAVLLRGFDVTTAVQFSQLCAALSDQLLDYTERSTPRTKVEDGGGKVYTSTEYPPHAHIPLHCEMAYATQWPRIIWFYSHVAAEEGGETPICDAREIHRLISQATRERFIAKGVMYVRNFHKGIDLPWQQVYGVTNEAELEAYCREHQIDFEWKPNGGLRTRSVAQATAKHPVTGELAWFNQAHLFHISAIEPRIRQVLLTKFKEEGLPRNAYYGDGAPIEEGALAEINAAYKKSEIVFPWQRGDVLMVDNMLVSHGRRPFKGPRTTLVAMAEAYSVDRASR